MYWGYFAGTKWLFLTVWASLGQKDWSCQDACNKVVYHTDSSFGQLAGAGSDVSPGIKGRFKAATDLHSRVDSGVTQGIIYKLETIVEVMRELRQSLEVQVTEEGVSVYGRVQGAIEEMIHHVGKQTDTLFGEFRKYKEDYQRYVEPSVKFFTANVWTQQKSLITIINLLTKLQTASYVDSESLSQATAMLQQAKNTFEETDGFLLVFLERNAKGKIYVPPQTVLRMAVSYLPQFYADPPSREKCINRAKNIRSSEAYSRLWQCSFVFNLTEEQVHGVNETIEWLGLEDQQNLTLEFEEVKNCYLEYSKALDRIEERQLHLSAGSKLFIDSKPLQHIADALAKGQNSIDELAKNYIGNHSQLSDLAEFVSNESSKYFKHFQAPGLAESVTKNAAEPLLKYAAEQQQLLQTQLEGALQDHLLLYDYVENDTLTAVARRLEIWRKPIPNLELEQVGESLNQTGVCYRNCIRNGS